MELVDDSDDSDYEIPDPPLVQAPKPPKNPKNDHEIKASMSPNNVYDLPFPKSSKNVCDVFPTPKSSKNVYTPDPTSAEDTVTIAIKEEDTIGEENNVESKENIIRSNTITESNKPGHPPEIPIRKPSQVPKPVPRRDRPKSEYSASKGSSPSDLTKQKSLDQASLQTPPPVPMRDYDWKRSTTLPLGSSKQQESVSKKQPPPISPRRKTQSKPKSASCSEQPSVSEKDKTENASLMVTGTDIEKTDAVQSQTAKEREYVPPPIPAKRKPSQKATNRHGPVKSAIYSVPRQPESKQKPMTVPRTVPDSEVGIKCTDDKPLSALQDTKVDKIPVTASNKAGHLGARGSLVGNGGSEEEAKMPGEVGEFSFAQISLGQVSLEDKEESDVSATRTEKQSIGEVLQIIGLIKHEEEMTTNQVDFSLLLDLAEEDLICDIGMTRFEARKLLLYVQNRWRPDGCAGTDPEGVRKGVGEEGIDTEIEVGVTEVKKWTCEVVSTNMAEEIKLANFARFCIENQVNGKLLINILDKEMLQSIREDYGVTLSKIEEAKLNRFVLKGWRPTT